MRRLAGGTRGRLVAFSIGVLAVALLLGDSAVLFSLSISVRAGADSVLVEQASMLSRRASENSWRIGSGRYRIPDETPTGARVDAAVVSSHAIVAQSANQPLAPGALFSLAAHAASANGPYWTNLVDSRGAARRAYAVPLTTPQGPPRVLVVSRSPGPLESDLAGALIPMLAFSMVLLLIGGVLAYWLAGRVLRPVRTIAGLARSISEHDLHRRVDVKVPPDELGELVDTFNSMLARLEGGFDSLKRFTADASHELRAPLALMRSELDGALSRKRSPEEYRRVLTSLQGEVEHLGRIADQLLMLARADAGALVPARERVDVADFLHETAARWEAVAESRGAFIDVGAPSSGQAEADPALLRRVLDNLIDNGLRHAPAGSGVLLRGRAIDGGWDIEVADQGPGVALEHRERLFTRFARSDQSRTPEGGGAGLGLALSAAIARAHGGTLELVDDQGPGARFRIHLPGS